MGFECLRQLDLFSDLNSDEMEKVMDMASTKTYSKGETLFLEGDSALQIYVIKSGSIKLYKTSDEGKELTLGFVRQNNMLGEDTIFSNECYSLSAQAVEDSCIVIFSHKNLEALLLNNPKIAVKALKYMSKKLSQAEDQISNMAFSDARGRLVKSLLRLAEEYGAPLNGDGLLIDLRLTHQDLANLTSLSRASVTNILLGLRDNGYIGIANKRIVVKDALMASL